MTSKLRAALEPSTLLWLTEVLDGFFSQTFPQHTTLSQACIEVYVLMGGLAPGAPPRTAAQLAAELGRPRTTVQKSVDRMVEAGWLRHVAAREDARQHPVELTEAGRDRARELLNSATAWRAEIAQEIYDRDPSMVPLAMSARPDAAVRSLVDFLAEVEPLLREAVERHLRGSSTP